MDKVLIIVRGASGSGKTTLANYLAREHGIVTSADDFLTNADGVYDWHWSKLSAAHKACEDKVKDAMDYSMPKIIVANTFTTEKEVQTYIDIAKSYGYSYFSVVVENRHGGTNVHDVPEDSVTKQKNKLLKNIKL